MILVLGVAVFLGVFLAILFVNLILTDLFKEDREAQLRDMEIELRQRMREHARRSAQQDELGDVNMGSDRPGHFSIVDAFKSFQKLVQQAGLKADPQVLGFIGLVGGAIAGLAAYFVTGNPLVAGALMFLGAAMPVVYILHKRKQRMDQLAEQLPEALELMARVLRAGQTITQAMNGVADEFTDPIGTEFGFCYEQQNLGLPLETAMQNMVDRTGMIEIKILVMGVSIQRQAGGNLAELLNKLSDVMRERHKLRGTVKALTAEGRMQAIVLGALPFCTWVAMYVMNRPYAMKLIDHPPLIYGSLFLMAIGLVWIRKIVNFDF